MFLHCNSYTKRVISSCDLIYKTILELLSSLEMIKYVLNTRVISYLHLIL